MNPQIYFFYCGAGDTILAGVNDEWALIDCNLTADSGVRKRLLNVLEKHNVTRLRFVCVTHYDSDHLRGLGDLLESRFSEELGDGTDRRRWLVEQVIQPLQVKDIDRAMPKLHAIIDRLHKSKKKLAFSKQALRFLDIAYRMLIDSDALPPQERVYFPVYDSVPHFLGVPPFIFRQRALLGPFEVGFLAPEQPVADRFEVGKLSALYDANPRAEVLLDTVTNNAISRVVVFRHTKTSQAVLFSGDAPSDCWTDILRRWEQFRPIGLRNGETPRWREFHVVKVSHHGSVHSHHQPLYSTWCVPDKTVAVISTRTGDPDHPHQTVMDDLLSSRMDVRLTCPHGVLRRRLKRGPFLGGRSVAPKPQATDIHIEFKPTGLTVTPIPI